MIPIKRISSEEQARVGEMREKQRGSWKVRKEGREVKSKEKTLNWKERLGEKEGGEEKEREREENMECQRWCRERERQSEMTECWHQRASSPSTSLSLHEKSILPAMDNGVNSSQDQQLYSLTSTTLTHRVVIALFRYHYSHSDLHFLGCAPEQVFHYL